MIRSKWLHPALAAALLTTGLLIPSTLQAQKSPQVTVPEVAREFRGAWVATVSNIDWPSAKNLTPAQQQKELIQILDRVAKLKMNAVILQVRPMCDAFYNSKYEPWSVYLTGTQGKAPSPYYDPLAFAITEAHKRGLELHAWFNPYRAGLSSVKTYAPSHISKTRPDLVRTYGKYLWLDPGETEVQLHSLNVIMDVVKRYDVDGIHFDDYFYPYREENLEFPDEPSWQKYQKAGGRLNRGDWRRENVNSFIRRLNTEIHKEKSWVKFGISPFGIWRPGYPASVKGLDSYTSIYTDSRKWLADGWCDYFAPQLYWSIDAKEQSFPDLLNWWVKQNPKQRHIWPGMSNARINETRAPTEITKQIEITRKTPGATGNIHWSVKSLMRNQGEDKKKNLPGITDLVAKEVYTQPALIPASPWLGRSTPQAPALTLRNTADGTRLTWQSRSSETVALWVVQQRANGKWTTTIIPGNTRSATITRKAGETAPDLVTLRAVNRYGNVSQPDIGTVVR